MISRRIGNNYFTGLIATVMVLAFSLALLTYVGYGEARRIYPRFEIAKVAAQGELVKNSIEQILLSNLPLKQFPGFSPLTNPVLESTQSLSAIYVTDTTQQPVFVNGREGDDSFAVPSASDFQTSRLQAGNTRYDVTESGDNYQISLTLKNKFEAVGKLNLLLPKSVISRQIDTDFFYVVMAAVVLLVLYAGFILIKGRSKQSQESTLWMAISYGVIFLVMAMVVIVTLVILYSGGIQGKTEALAKSLGERLNVPLKLGLEIDSLDKLDQTFKNYQELNPDLSYVALTRNNQIVIHTNPAQVGKQWQAENGYFKQDVRLEQAAEKGQLEVHVGIPTSLVFGELWQAAKNFIALFVASILLSTLFFNLINASNRYRGSERAPAARQAFDLSLVAPFYFLIVFADSLTNSFLPQYFRELAVKEQFEPSTASMLFTVYFAAYALSLVITSQLSERENLKLLFMVGPMLIISELLILAFVQNFYAMFVVQALAGLGQGIAFIGVQSFILRVAARMKRTRSAALIVFGYNGGVLSGIAIGGLLAADPTIGRQGVFLTGGIIATLVLVYAALLIPKKLATAEAVEAVALVVGEPVGTQAPVHTGFWSGLGQAFSDFRFIKGAFFIGIPTKIVMAGLITATLPLLLAQQSYQTEDIAQIIMFYSAVVLLSSRPISTLADKTGRIGLILFIGSVLGGVGLILIGLIGWSGIFSDSTAYLKTVVLIIGLMALGLSHGCIQAPVITYMSNTRTANVLGRSAATSIYRLFERIGNIGGPLLISQLLVLSSGNISAISFFGMALIGLGILFAFRLPKGSRQLQQAESKS